MKLVVCYGERKNTHTDRCSRHDWCDRRDLSHHAADPSNAAPSGSIPSDMLLHDRRQVVLKAAGTNLSDLCTMNENAKKSIGSFDQLFQRGVAIAKWIAGSVSQNIYVPQGTSERSNHRHAVSAERRSKTRNVEVELQCSLGQVLDISSTGMRVACRRVPKEKWVKFVLNAEVDPLPVHAKVVWAKRLGFRKHEVGLLFINPSPELDKLISSCLTIDGRSCWKPSASNL